MIFLAETESAVGGANRMVSGTKADKSHLSQARFNLDMCDSSPDSFSALHSLYLQNTNQG